MKLFLGLDSSTQSLSAAVIDLDTGAVVADFSLNFGKDFPAFNCPSGFLENADPLVRQSDPLLWCAALDRLCAELPAHGIDPANIVGISGSGQQHGSVYLDAEFATKGLDCTAKSLGDAVRPRLTRAVAPIWMDSSTSAECAEIAAAVGGAEKVRAISGSGPIERFTGPQIRKFWKDDPTAYAKTGVIHLVSSFMASLLTGKSAAIDTGDGAGMNLLNLATAQWDAALLAATAPGLGSKLPPVAKPGTRLGVISDYFVRKYGFRAGTPVIAWSGDNPCSLVGVGAAEPGVAVVSLGTSHTFFAAMPQPKVDPDGYGHVFGNPAGGFMSLICFKNGALAQEAVRTQFGLDWRQFDECLRQTPPGNHGNLMLPYFVTEITPLVLQPGPVCCGTAAFVAGQDAAAAVRAVVEAQAMRLKLHAQWMGVTVTRLRVTGGAAKSDPVCQILANVFNATVERLVTGNSAGLGAALMAAQGVTGVAWNTLFATFCKAVPGGNIAPQAAAVATYAESLTTYAAFARQTRS